MNSMWRRITGVLVAILLMLSAVPVFAVGAGPMNEVQLGGNQEPRVRPNETQVWYFTPEESGEYLLFTKSDRILLAQIHGVEISYSCDLAGEYYDAYDLTAGQTYEVHVSLNPDFYDQYPNGYADTFRIEKYRPLQSITISASELTGQRDEYHSLYVDADPYYWPLDGLTWTSSDENIVTIESVEGNGCFFRLRGVGTAVITAQLGECASSCTVTVERETGVWDSYEVWPETQNRKEITLINGEAKLFSFTPSQTGDYVLATEQGKVHADLQQTNWLYSVPIRHILTGKADYMVYSLIAGETYVVSVVSNTMDTQTQTGTVMLEKMRPLESATVFSLDAQSETVIRGYTGGRATLFVRAEPDYGLDYLTGWESGNESVVYLEEVGGQLNQSCNILLVGAGKTTVSAVFGGKAFSLTVEVVEAPELKVGKTVKMDWYGTSGALCPFTPEASGTYRFLYQGGGGTVVIEGTNYGNYYEKSGSMDAYLEAGRTYLVGMPHGCDTVSIQVQFLNGNQMPGDDPADPGDDPVDPGDDPVDPGDDPVDPGDDPVNPGDDPVDPGEDPVEPDDKPADPSKPVETPQPPIRIEISIGPDMSMKDVVREEAEKAEKGSVLVLKIEDPRQMELPVDGLKTAAERDITIEISAPDAVLILDPAALRSIAHQADGDALALNIHRGTQEQLEDVQRKALEEQKVLMVFSAQILLGDAEIHDFGDGKVEIRLPFTPEEGRTVSEYSVCHVSGEGRLEKIPSSYENGFVCFETGHFSDFVIVRSNDVNAVDSSWLLWVLLGVGVAAVTAVAWWMMKKGKNQR